MNKYYLVKYKGNYADEFDVYFHCVMDEEKLRDTKKVISKTDWWYKEFYFGTNEFIEVCTEDLIKWLDSSEEITKEQYKVLCDLNVAHISFGNGLNWDHFVNTAINE